MSGMSRNVLITGATDGIGLALAQRYAEQGDRPLLVGRRPLAALDPDVFTAQNYVQADLAADDAAARVADFLAAQAVDALHIVIHNAGIGYVGEPAGQLADNVAELVSVNLVAPVLLTQAFVPLLHRGHGKLVFISSVAAAMATPDYAVYTATKAALDGFARSLRIEQGDELPILVVHVGATRTGMHRKAGADLGRMNWARFPAPETVAAQIVRSIDNATGHVSIGLGNRMLYRAGRLLGGWLDRLQVRMSR
ncbi:MAG: SDR family NAD(P)-dependent oxidoreductase [Caldilineaceae bacterium]|nr:SDR family NAD(P)-dependent oxidoreductase [Caldilineaceae bacterium]